MDRDRDGHKRRAQLARELGLRTHPIVSEQYQSRLSTLRVQQILERRASKDVWDTDIQSTSNIASPTSSIPQSRSREDRPMASLGFDSGDHKRTPFDPFQRAEEIRRRRSFPDADGSSPIAEYNGEAGTRFLSFEETLADDAQHNGTARNGSGIGVNSKRRGLAGEDRPVPYASTWCPPEFEIFDDSELRIYGEEPHERMMASKPQSTSQKRGTVSRSLKGEEQRGSREEVELVTETDVESEVKTKQIIKQRTSKEKKDKITTDHVDDGDNDHESGVYEVDLTEIDSLTSTSSAPLLSSSALRKLKRKQDEEKNNHNHLSPSFFSPTTATGIGEDRISDDAIAPDISYLEEISQLAMKDRNTMRAASIYAFHRHSETHYLDLSSIEQDIDSADEDELANEQRKATANRNTHSRRSTPWTKTEFGLSKILRSLSRLGNDHESDRFREAGLRKSTILSTLPHSPKPIMSTTSTNSSTMLAEGVKKQKTEHDMLTTESSKPTYPYSANTYGEMSCGFLLPDTPVRGTKEIITSTTPVTTKPTLALTVLKPIMSALHLHASSSLTSSAKPCNARSSSFQAPNLVLRYRSTDQTAPTVVSALPTVIHNASSVAEILPRQAYISTSDSDDLTIYDEYHRLALIIAHNALQKHEFEDGHNNNKDKQPHMTKEFDKTTSTQPCLGGFEPTELFYAMWHPSQEQGAIYNPVSDLEKAKVLRPSKTNSSRGLDSKTNLELSEMRDVWGMDFPGKTACVSRLSTCLGVLEREKSEVKARSLGVAESRMKNRLRQREQEQEVLTKRAQALVPAKQGQTIGLVGTQQQQVERISPSSLSTRTTPSVASSSFFVPSSDLSPSPSVSSIETLVTEREQASVVSTPLPQKVHLSTSTSTSTSTLTSPPPSTSASSRDLSSSKITSTPQDLITSSFVTVPVKTCECVLLQVQDTSNVMSTTCNISHYSYTVSEEELHARGLVRKLLFRTLMMKLGQLQTQWKELSQLIQTHSFFSAKKTSLTASLLSTLSLSQFLQLWRDFRISLGKNETGDKNTFAELLFFFRILSSCRISPQATISALEHTIITPLSPPTATPSMAFSSLRRVPQEALVTELENEFFVSFCRDWGKSQNSSQTHQSFPIIEKRDKEELARQSEAPSAVLPTLYLSLSQKLEILTAFLPSARSLAQDLRSSPWAIPSLCVYFLFSSADYTSAPSVLTDEKSSVTRRQKEASTQALSPRQLLELPRIFLATSSSVETLEKELSERQKERVAATDEEIFTDMPGMVCVMCGKHLVSGAILTSRRPIAKADIWGSKSSEGNTNKYYCRGCGHTWITREGD